MLARPLHVLPCLLLLCAPGCGGSEGDGGGGGGGSGGGGGVEAGQLTAGAWDDNASFGHFLDTLDELRDGADLPVPALADRVVIHVTDGMGAPLSGQTVTVASAEGPHLVAPTATDGRLLFFPERDRAPAAASFAVTVGNQTFPAPPGSEWTFQVSGIDAVPPTGLDVAFVIDATGSMSDEIEYLKAEVADIATKVQESDGDASMRFALVMYRDEGDEYVTRTTDFTDLDSFQESLDQQQAGGGGDYPEAMDEAMAAASALTWRDGNVARVAFLIADAPPHAQNAGRFLSLVEDHRRAGVKIYPVAASGVAREAEYLMRLAAQATLSRYIFLTDDSGIGDSHEEPLIPCYDVELLGALLTRVLRSELAGTWFEPDADDIIRSVGDPEDGTCSETP